MKHKKRSVFLSICLPALVLVFASCASKADFTIDKGTYAAGDEVIVTDLSKHASNYRWTLSAEGNGFTAIGYTSSKPTVRISPSAPDGDYTLTLSLMNKNGDDVVSFASHSFLVKTVRASLFVYSRYGEKADVMADDQQIGTLSGNNNINVNIAVGVRYLKAGIHSKTFNVKEGDRITWDIDSN